MRPSLQEVALRIAPCLTACLSVRLSRIPAPNARTKSFRKAKIGGEVDAARVMTN